MTNPIEQSQSDFEVWFNEKHPVIDQWGHRAGLDFGNTAKVVMAAWQAARAPLEAEIVRLNTGDNLAAIINEDTTALMGECVVMQEKIASLTLALEKAEKDTELLDWLNENFYSGTMDDFDKRMYPNSWQWKFYAPKDVQSDIRLVLNAALRRDKA